MKWIALLLLAFASATAQQSEVTVVIDGEKLPGHTWIYGVCNNQSIYFSWGPTEDSNKLQSTFGADSTNRFAEHTPTSQHIFRMPAWECAQMLKGLPAPSTAPNGAKYSVIPMTHCTSTIVEALKRAGFEITDSGLLEMAFMTPTQLEQAIFEGRLLIKPSLGGGKKPSIQSSRNTPSGIVAKSYPDLEELMVKVAETNIKRRWEAMKASGLPGAGAALRQMLDLARETAPAGAAKLRKHLEEGMEEAKTFYETCKLYAEEKCSHETWDRAHQLYNNAVAGVPKETLEGEKKRTSGNSNETVRPGQRTVKEIWDQVDKRAGEIKVK